MVHLPPDSMRETIGRSVWGEPLTRAPRPLPLDPTCGTLRAPGAMICHDTGREGGEGGAGQRGRGRLWPGTQ